MRVPNSVLSGACEQVELSGSRESLDAVVYCPEFPVPVRGFQERTGVNSGQPVSGCKGKSEQGELSGK